MAEVAPSSFCMYRELFVVSCVWQNLKCSLISMVTIVILISGNPSLLSRSFRVNVNMKLSNYLGNLSNLVIKNEKVAPIHWETEAGLALSVGGDWMG